MLSIKKLLFIPLPSLLLFVLPAMQQGLAEDAATHPPTDRAALTQEILELQRDLLLLKEKHVANERLALSIYLSLNLQTINKLDSISLLLDEQIIFQDSINQKQLDILLAGGIKKLHSQALQPGKYKLKVIMKAGRKTLSDRFLLEKSAERDSVTITLSSSLQQRAPEISFQHQTWAATQ